MPSGALPRDLTCTRKSELNLSTMKKVRLLAVLSSELVADRRAKKPPMLSLASLAVIISVLLKQISDISVTSARQSLISSYTIYNTSTQRYRILSDLNIISVSRNIIGRSSKGIASKQNTSLNLVVLLRILELPQQQLSVAYYMFSESKCQVDTKLRRGSVEDLILTNLLSNLYASSL